MLQYILNMFLQFSLFNNMHIINYYYKFFLRLIILNMISFTQFVWKNERKVKPAKSQHCVLNNPKTT